MGLQIRFFVKFPLSGGQQIGVRLDHAFGNGPGAVVFLRPIGTARMCQQNFKFRTAAECDETGADFRFAGHRRNLL